MGRLSTPRLAKVECIRGTGASANRSTGTRHSRRVQTGSTSSATTWHVTKRGTRLGYGIPNGTRVIRTQPVPACSQTSRTAVSSQVMTSITSTRRISVTRMFGLTPRSLSVWLVALLLLGAAVAIPAETSPTSWDSLRPHAALEAEHFASLERVAESADLIVIATATETRLTRTVGTGPETLQFAELDLSVSRYVRGSFRTASPNSSPRNTSLGLWEPNLRSSGQNNGRCSYCDKSGGALLATASLRQSTSPTSTGWSVPRCDRRQSGYGGCPAHGSGAV
jgi:hypothetical protein